MTISRTLRRIPGAPPFWLQIISWCFFGWALLTVHLPWTFGGSFSVLEYLEQAIRVPGPGGPSAAAPSGITFISKPGAGGGTNTGVCPVEAGSPVNCTSFDTTGANWIGSWVSGGSPATVSVTVNGSSLGNMDCTHEALGITLCFMEGATGGPNTVLNLSGCNFCIWGAAAFSGMKASGSYDANLASNTNTGTSIQPGAINPGAGKHLVITAQKILSGSANSDVFTQDLTYVTLGFQPNGGLSPSSAAGYLIQNPGASTNPTVTYTTSQFLEIVIASWSGA